MRMRLKFLILRKTFPIRFSRFVRSVIRLFTVNKAKRYAMYMDDMSDSMEITKIMIGVYLVDAIVQKGL